MRRCCKGDNSKTKIAMYKRIAKYLFHFSLWALLIVAVVLASRLSKSYKDSVMVSGIDIEVAGGGENPLITSQDINIWLKEQGVYPEGCVLSQVDIAAIERVVASHGAVAKVNAYQNYEGRVKITIEQREPIARLRIEGYDMYLTADGCVLPAEGYAPALVKVVTGNYAPLFDSSYVGSVEAIVRDSMASLDKMMAQLEESKRPHYKRHEENNAALKEVRRSAPKRSIWESKRSYAVLEQAYKDSLSRATERHSINSRKIDEDIAAIDRAIDEVLALKHSLSRQSDEYNAMVAMIRYIVSDSFFNADVVQIVATGGGDKSLQLAVVPRVANVTVDLGTTENLQGKLATLRRFYEKGLSRIGWDKYSHISLRYDGQVVCR